MGLHLLFFAILELLCFVLALGGFAALYFRIDVVNQSILNKEGCLSGKYLGLDGSRLRRDGAVSEERVMVTSRYIKL